MAQTLQHRRATTVGLQGERGSEGEIFMDTSKKTLVAMDGSTLGGHPMAKESDIPVNVSELINDAGYITSAVVFSGSYDDLTDKPTLFSGAYADLTGKPTLFSGAYADLTGAPALFDGQYSSLSGIPTEFTPSSHTQAFSTITDTPTTLAGYGITDASPLFNQNLNTANNVTFSEVRADFYGNVWSADNTMLLLDANNKVGNFVDISAENVLVGNTHSISPVDDFTMQFGPNDARIYFGTPLQNWYQIQNIDQILLSADTAVSITLPDESQWTFGLGGGIDFPDGSTQTTAYVEPDQGLNTTDNVIFNRVALTTGEINVANTNFDVYVTDQLGNVSNLKLDTNGVLTTPGSVTISSGSLYTNFVYPRSSSNMQIGDGNMSNNLEVLLTSQRVRIVSKVPTTSIGQSGDTNGNVAFDSGYMYYCTTAYDGVTNIWKRVAWSVDTW